MTSQTHITLKLTEAGHYLDLELDGDTLTQRTIHINGSHSTIISTHRCRYLLNADLRHIHDGNGWNFHLLHKLAKTARAPLIARKIVRKPARHSRRA